MEKCRTRQIKKNYIALAIGAFLCLNLMGSTVVATAVVKPIVKVASVKLSKTKEALIVNKTDTLKTTIKPLNATNKAVIWKSLNIKVANVDKLGKITAGSVGAATITATTVDGSKWSNCIVTVTKPATTTTPSSTVRGVARPVVPSKPVYNGSVIKEKVRSIEGVFDLNGGLELNKYGKQGAGQYTYFDFNVCSGDRDINLTIMASNPEVDKK